MRTIQIASHIAFAVLGSFLAQKFDHPKNSDGLRDIVIGDEARRTTTVDHEWISKHSQASLLDSGGTHIAFRIYGPRFRPPKMNHIGGKTIYLTNFNI